MRGEVGEVTDHLSDRSGFGSQSDRSGLLVERPSDSSGSQISHPSSDGTLTSTQISLGSNPISSDSNRDSSNLVSVTEDANYLLARSDAPHMLDESSALLESAHIPLFVGDIPHSLNISVQNQKDIREVLSTIGSNTALQLGWNSLPSLMKTAPSKPDMISHLKALGAKIDKEVHPYRFLLEIFLDKDSKTSIMTLYNGRNDLLTGRNLMWTEFVTNLGKSFDNRKEDIAPHTQFFAQALRIRSSKVDHFSRKINEFVQAKNWNGLLEYLITHVKTPAL